MTNNAIQRLFVGELPTNHPLETLRSANGSGGMIFAPTVHEALLQLNTVGAEVDVVLLALDDHTQPDWNQLAEMRIPIVALCPDDTIGKQAIENGAIEYLLYEDATPSALNRFCRLALRYDILQRDCRTNEAHYRHQAEYSYNELLKLSRVVEHSPASIVITDADGLIEYVNPKFTQLTGYDLDEVIGQTPRILKSGHTSTKDYEQLWQTIKSGQEWCGEFHNRNKNGEFYWEQAWISAIQGPDGGITHFIAIKEDITERKRIETELVASEALRREMFERHAAIKLLMDADTGQIVDANPAACRYYGYSREQLVSMTIQQINTLSPEEVAAERQRALREERNYFQFKHRLSDGSIRDIETYASPIVVGGRKLLYSLVHDITDRVEAEKQVQQLNQELAATASRRYQQLRRVNDRMAAVLNSTSDAIVSIDDGDQIGDTNPAFAVMFDYPKDTQEHIAISEVIAPEYRHEFCNALKSFRARGEPDQIRVRARRRDGTHFDADCAFGRGQHSGYIVCSIRNISRFVEAGRMRDRFISMVNHELRTPITAITLSSNLLHTYYARMTDEKRLAKIQQIIHQARVMTDLIESILDLSRLDTSEERVFTHLDVCPMAHEMISELQESAESKHQQISITCTADNQCKIEANEQDIRRIWRNLIGNAIKYTPENGQIHVRIGGMTVCDGKLQEGPAPPFEVPPDLKPGSYLVGQVEDNGPGIPPDDIEQLFSRFYRGWAAGSHIPGTGLGLALVKEVLAFYGGDIVVTSQLGAGSCFTFFIPRVQQVVEDRATVGY